MDPAKAEFLFGRVPMRADPDDPDDRSVLLREQGFGRDDGPGRFRLAMYEVIANQIAQGEPPEAWETASRLLEMGLDRRRVLHNMVLTINAEVQASLAGDRKFDVAEYVAALRRLPLPTAEEVQAAMVPIARHRQPIRVDELESEAMAKLSMPIREEPFQTLMDLVSDRAVDPGGPLALLAGDRVVHPESLLEEVVLTHRLAKAERAADRLDVGVDLVGFARWNVPPKTKAGEDLRLVYAEDGLPAWQGPDGWLRRFEAGSLLAVRAADGAVVIDALHDNGDQDPDLALVARVRSVYDDEVEGPGLPVHVEDILLGLVAAERSGRTNGWPSACTGSSIGWATRMTPMPPCASSKRLTRGPTTPAVFAARWQISARLACSMQRWTRCSASTTTRDGLRRPRHSRKAFWHSPQAVGDLRCQVGGGRGLRASVRPAGRRGPPASGGGGRRKLGAGGRPAGLVPLRPRRGGRRGQALAAPRSGSAGQRRPARGRAVRPGPRTQARTQRAVLVRIRPEVQGLPSRPAGRLLAPRPSRVAVPEGRRYLERRGGRALPDVFDLASTRVGDDDGDDLSWAMEDPFVIDVALHELGWTEPSSRSWSPIRGSVYRFRTSVAPNVSRFVIARSATTLGGKRWSAGGQSPTGRPHQFVGGLFTVAPGTESGLLDLLDQGDPFEFMLYLASLERPPTLTTREGELLVACTAVLDLPDPDAARAALNRLYRRGEGNTWVEMHTLEDGDEVVRVSFHLDGGRLDIEAMSEPRIDRALSVLMGAIDGARMVSEDRRLVHPGRLPQAGSTPEAFPLDEPAVRAAMESWLDRMEHRWCDEPVPALSGMTPRQAAADPTRRETLERLLASFEDSGGLGTDGPSTMTMRAARLRSLLGLADNP